MKVDIPKTSRVFHWVLGEAMSNMWRSAQGQRVNQEGMCVKDNILLYTSWN